MIRRLKAWAGSLKRDVLALWFACRDPRTPALAKILAIVIVAYALSPIDLIPDFIPVLGYLDEIILLPLGIWLVIKLVPRDAMADARAKAQAWVEERRPKPRNWIAAGVIIAIWVALLWAAWTWLIWPLFYQD
jgi:uncharacterized membrane protein YkvA (DUF1232 family)